MDSSQGRFCVEISGENAGRESRSLQPMLCANLRSRNRREHLYGRTRNLNACLEKKGNFIGSRHSHCDGHVVLTVKGALTLLN